MMHYYHCSPTSGLQKLEPRKPKSFHKPARVYMTTLLPMALMYGIRNYEYTYGYTKDGQIYLEEYFPNALEVLYRGRGTSLYLCEPHNMELTNIPNEVVSATEVTVLKEIYIPDVCEALLAQERLGNLVIRRYEKLSESELKWIRKAEADTIRKHDLIHNPGDMADYYKTYYPESWNMVRKEKETRPE